MRFSLRSLRVHRCHGARREVEVLRDELLEAFQRDPSLKPEDVLILAPDLETYGPLCQALLPQAVPALPLKLAERRLDQQDPAFQAMAALLSFAAGRATLSEGLGLLELPAVRAKLGEAATQTLQDRLDSSGITFGLRARGERHSWLRWARELLGAMQPVFAWDDPWPALWESQRILAGQLSR